MLDSCRGSYSDESDGPATAHAARATLFLSTLLNPSRLAQAQAPSSGSSQSKLSAHWEELTGPDFINAIRSSQGTCLLPIGILENAWPPSSYRLRPAERSLYGGTCGRKGIHHRVSRVLLRTDRRGAGEPGTVAYSREMQLALLQATTDEMGRNGCKKIPIINGHGGNGHLLPYFAQTQLDKPHDYVVYIFDQRTPATGGPKKNTPMTSMLEKARPRSSSSWRPIYVHSGSCQGRIGRRSASSESARGRLHRHLVVRSLSPITMLEKVRLEIRSWASTR